MDRRRTDRRKQMEMVLGSIYWYFFAPFQRPITGKWNARSHSQFRIQNRLKFSNCEQSCGNPVQTIPLFVTRNVVSQHELFLELVFRAVNALQLRVLGHLEKAELREGDVWAQQDYRTAQVVLILADEGRGNAYSKAFYQLFGRNAHEVRFWWRDRVALYRLCEIGGSSTPLLHANIADQLENELIPDYDPTLQVSPAALSRQAPRNADPVSQWNSHVDGSRGNSVSPVAPLLPPRAHPANTPAPVRTTGAGDRKRTA